jgi:site-specific recombinase XerD
MTRSGATALSPYRVVDLDGREIEAVNAFLDATAVRGLSRETLRTYAYALLSVWRWMQKRSLSLADLTESQLADYIRYLREEVPRKKPPAPRSINLQLVIVRSLYRFELDSELPRAARTPIEAQPVFVRPSRVGVCARRHLGRPALRVKVPRRLIVPLKREEVLRFFESFRTYRDLSIAGLMLFLGLRSREVLLARIRDLSVVQEELRVIGKGDKDRVLPLAPYVKRALSSYLALERPATRHDLLFVSLKGPARGRPMSAVGLRKLFRHHRKQSGVEGANPHRFRHTFGADMAREGMPLPVLMRLMGHTTIGMTLRYANLSAEDVREEFDRALGRLTKCSHHGLPKCP